MNLSIKIKNVEPLENFMLSVTFTNGVEKIYDVKTFLKSYLKCLNLYKIIHRYLKMYVLILAVSEYPGMKI